MEKQTFDYIVVGAGAAGCALAARLAEDPARRILLLEAGSDNRHIWLKLPLGIGKVLDDERFVWPLRSAPEANLNGRQLYWAQGRILGGSSSVNAMLVVRGEPARYDQWRGAGCPGWGYDDLAPVFERIENCLFPCNEARGRNGPVPVTRMPPEDPISQGFIAACEQSGLPYNDDYNDGDSYGVAHQQFNIRNGLRVSAANAYLEPMRKRGNITIHTGARVERLLFEDLRAAGVSVILGRERVEIEAREEIILSAGALHTPQILELSGIGDGDLLRQLGIPVIKHLPAVGEHLRDHLQTRITFEASTPVTVNDLLNSRWHMLREMLRFVLFRRGLFATPSFRVHAFDRSEHAEDCPDVRIQCGLISGPGRYAHEGVDDFPGFHIGSYFIYPRSHGFVHLASPDPREQPQMRANYLDDELDRAVTVWALNKTRALANLPGLRELTLREVRPGKDAGGGDLLELARDSGQTAWHFVGSCKMGSDERSVVGPNLKVHGTANLRVADASVMPFHVSSNTHVPCIAIGEKAADLILGEQKA